MKKWIQSYLAFSTVLWRVLVFLALPLLCMAGQILIKPADYVLTTFFLAMAGMLAEVILDNWSFGGIAAKGVGQPEYLKTSARGRAVVKHALMAGMIRQLLEHALIFLACGMISWLQGGNEAILLSQLPLYLAVFFLEYFFVVATLTITRFFDGWMINMGIAGAAVLLMVGGIYLIAIAAHFMLILLLVLSAAVSVLHVKIIMRRVEESYYDKAD